MEPLWEYRWAYWNEFANRFEQTPLWMTEDEARTDWHAYDDQRSYRIEHTRRDRNRSSGPAVEPPTADVDWTRERRVRAERSRFGLPPFVTPLYAELRRIWSEHPHEDVRRLALEIQTGRYAIAELEAVASEEYWYMRKDGATIDDARRSLARIRRRLQREMARIGPITGDRR